MEYVIQNNWLEEGWDYSFKRVTRVVFSGEVTWVVVTWKRKVGPVSGFRQGAVSRQRAWSRKGLACLKTGRRSMVKQGEVGDIHRSQILRSFTGLSQKFTFCSMYNGKTQGFIRGSWLNLIYVQRDWGGMAGQLEGYCVMEWGVIIALKMALKRRMADRLKKYLEGRLVEVRKHSWPLRLISRRIWSRPSSNTVLPQLPRLTVARQGKGVHILWQSFHLLNKCMFKWVSPIECHSYLSIQAFKSLQTAYYTTIKYLFILCKYKICLCLKMECLFWH